MLPPILTAIPSVPGLWLAVAGLGAYHGLNPGMGWLFAVALGLQRGRGWAVWGAMGPIALGHALSIALVAGAVGALGAYLPPRPLQALTAGLLLAFGLLRLARPRHPRWVGMRVGWRGLALWSFLTATAHGAGLMLAPVLVGLASLCGRLGPAGTGTGLAVAVALHTLAMLGTMALLAWLAYAVVGLAFLRRGWLNLDLFWGLALVAVGALGLAGIL